jgi:hypothetical protein
VSGGREDEQQRGGSGTSKARERLQAQLHDYDIHHVRKRRGDWASRDGVW